jgi:hypothetical protein
VPEFILEHIADPIKIGNPQNRPWMEIQVKLLIVVGGDTINTSQSICEWKYQERKKTLPYEHITNETTVF